MGEVTGGNGAAPVSGKAVVIFRGAHAIISLPFPVGATAREPR